MAQILSKVLDAILANVKLTIVASMANISKTAGDHRDHSSKFKAYTFFLMTAKNEENRTMGILDI
jgi:hypothetical protein